MREAAFERTLGELTMWAWENFGRYGWSLEIFMDEILDGRKIGLDIAVRQTTQGVLYSIPGEPKPFWMHVANICQRKDGSIEVYKHSEKDVKASIEEKLEAQRDFAKKRREVPYG